MYDRACVMIDTTNGGMGMTKNCPPLPIDDQTMCVSHQRSKNTKTIIGTTQQTMPDMEMSNVAFGRRLLPVASSPHHLGKFAHRPRGAQCSLRVSYAPFLLCRVRTVPYRTVPTVRLRAAVTFKSCDSVEVSLIVGKPMSGALCIKERKNTMLITADC